MSLKRVMSIYYEERIKSLIYDYIDNYYIELSEKHRDRVKAITIEVYYFLNFKERDIWTSIQSKDLHRFRLDIEARTGRIIFYYTDFLDILIELNFISRNDYYSYSNLNPDPKHNFKEPEKTKTKEYKINDVSCFNEDLLLEFNIDITKAHREELKKGMDEWLNDTPTTHHEHIKHIYRTSYDQGEVFDFMTKHKGEYTNKNKLITNATIKLYMNYVARFNNQFFNFKITEENRFYTPITIQPSFIRRFLIIDGESLIELDIKNSNPLFLTKYIENEDFKKSVTTGDPNKEFYNILLYEMNLIKVKENKPKITRQDIKNLSMKYIFFNKKPLKSGLLFNILQKRFYGFIIELNNLKVYYAENGIGLWTPLQSDESELILLRLMEVANKRNLVYLGMIDGILIKRSDKQTFLTILIELFDEKGLTPSIVMSDEINNIKEIYEINRGKILKLN